jgi:ribosomal protein S18 acetylase RimI-like enzyme
MTVSYRSLIQGDQQILWEMLHLAIFIPTGKEHPPRDVIFQSHLALYVEDWGRPDDLGVLALDEEIPVGAAWLRLIHGYGFVDVGIPELSISVVPGYRGAGIGSRLLQKVIEQARKSYAAISLSVSLDNPAVQLYERFGFKIVRKDDDTQVMLLDLEKATTDDD